MNFPTPQHLFNYAASPSPTKAHFRDASQDLSDEYQWDKFDELFDKVFAPARPEPQSPGKNQQTRFQDSRGGRSLRSLPGGFLADGAPLSGESSSDDVVGGFDDAWKDALRKTRKTVTTTTKRRIIRHTPPAPALEMPSPTSTVSRQRYPKTPYPQSDDDDNSSDEAMLGDPAPFPSSAQATARQLRSQERLPSSIVTSTPATSKQVVKFKPPKSRTEIEESTWMTATFDMPIGLPKSDIQVGYSMAYGAEKATVSWRHVTVEEIVEDGKLVREKKERKYHRSLPLPRGTKFDTIKAFLEDGLLTLVYPSRPGGDPAASRPIEVLQLTR